MFLLPDAFLRVRGWQLHRNSVCISHHDGELQSLLSCRNTIFISYHDRESQTLLSCGNFKTMVSSRMEISGGRSEFDIVDEHDSARTIAASFFTLFIFFSVSLYSAPIQFSNCFECLFIAYTYSLSIHIKLTATVFCPVPAHAEGALR